MKNKHVYLTLPCVIPFLIIISCNKEDHPPQPNVPQYSGPVIRKWNIVRHIDTINNIAWPPIYLDYQPTSNSDYLDFKPDGNLYSFENGTRDTATFTLDKDTLSISYKYLTIPTKFTIEVLTTDSLQLYGVAYVYYGSHNSKTTHYFLNTR